MMARRGYLIWTYVPVYYEQESYCHRAAWSYQHPLGQGISPPATGRPTTRVGVVIPDALIGASAGSVFNATEEANR